MLFPPLLAPLVRGSCVLSSSKSISPSGSLKRCELLISKLNVKHYTYPEFKSETLSSILATWSTSGLARARNNANFKRTSSIIQHNNKTLRFHLNELMIQIYFLQNKCSLSSPIFSTLFHASDLCLIRFFSFNRSA